MGGVNDKFPNISIIEHELQHMLAYSYDWRNLKQNNVFDRQTNFIYRTQVFSDVLQTAEAEFGKRDDYQVLLSYALNRWYNFWSSVAVERIFCQSIRVVPAKDYRDKLVDFEIDGIRFDHKTSVFPRGYKQNLSYAQNHPRSLIDWLYANQSREGRYHLKNRLFIVLHASNGQHWRLKANISWLKRLIDTYVQNFQPSQLHEFHFEQAHVTLSDIVWAID